jgi:hypothetical protein
VVSFTPHPLYPQGNNPWYPLGRRLGGSQNYKILVRQLNFPPKFTASLAEKTGRREMKKKKLNYKELTGVHM